MCFDMIPMGIKCSRFNCKYTICPDCINRMIKFCYDNFKVMPACHCECEYLYSNITVVLTDETRPLYTNICKQKLENVEREKIIAKEQTKRILDAFRADARAKLEILSPAIAYLISINGLEDKMIRTKKENAKRMEAFKAKYAGTRCVSFACKGILVNTDDALKCSKCELKVCIKCLHILGSNHECKQEEVESANVMRTVTKCPNCGVPAARVEGCIFVTCPFCNVKFDSNTGIVTPYGGHNKTTLVAVERSALSEAIDDEDMRMLLRQIERKKPSTTNTVHPATRYERMMCIRLYQQCVNMIYEYIDVGKLTCDVLKDMYAYVTMLDK